jgi:predicted nucleic acid-binding protein
VPKADALDFCRFLIKYSTITEETKDIVIDSLMLLDRYGLQVFDSKIVSAALHAGCNILYSEDMQHGLIVENKLTIINPFL